MILTRLAIQYDRVTWVLLAIVLTAGLQSFKDMPRAYDPGFIIRTAQIVTYFPGASAERVEALVTYPIEEVVKEIPELDFVQSESRSGVSIISVNISEAYSDMRPIWDDLRRKVDSLPADLPEGASKPQVNDDFGDVYGIVVGLTGEGFSFRELADVADEVKASFLQLEDASKIDILGLQDERVFLEYDDARLADLGLSPGQLAQILEQRNIVVSGGAFNLGAERVALEPSGSFGSIDEIGKTLLRLPGTNQLFQLKDVATLSRAYVDPATQLVLFPPASGGYVVRGRASLAWDYWRRVVELSLIALNSEPGFHWGQRGEFPSSVIMVRNNSISCIAPVRSQSGDQESQGLW